MHLRNPLLPLPPPLLLLPFSPPLLLLPSFSSLLSSPPFSLPSHRSNPFLLVSFLTSYTCLRPRTYTGARLRGMSVPHHLAVLLKGKAVCVSVWVCVCVCEGDGGKVVRARRCFWAVAELLCLFAIRSDIHQSHIHHCHLPPDSVSLLPSPLSSLSSSHCRFCFPSFSERTHFVRS